MHVPQRVTKFVLSVTLKGRGGSGIDWRSSHVIFGIRFAFVVLALVSITSCKDSTEIEGQPVKIEQSTDLNNANASSLEMPTTTSTFVEVDPDSAVPVVTLDQRTKTEEHAIISGTSADNLPNQKDKPTLPEYSTPSELIGLIRSFSPNGEILNIDTSADGKSIVFESAASNLVRGDTNQTTDVFLLLVEHRLLKRVSVDSQGGQVIGNSVNPRISPDGGWIVYESSAIGLDSRDTNQFKDIFSYEVGTGITTLVSVSLDETAGNRDSRKPVVSRDGRVIAFESEATNLIEMDENKASDVFAYNRLFESISIVSKPVRDIKTDANQRNLASYNPDISDDGNVITYESFSPYLALDDFNSNADVFLHNLESQSTSLVSKYGPKGALISGDSTNPSVSGDGKTVAFQSQAQFFKSDVNGVRDAFVYHTLAKKLTKLPAEELYEGESGGFHGSSRPVISGDGSVVVYVINFSEKALKGDQSVYGSHLAYYDVKALASGRLDLFETNNKTINNILDLSVSLSSDAEVLAFHMSRKENQEGGQSAPRSGWLSTKFEVN